MSRTQNTLPDQCRRREAAGHGQRDPESFVREMRVAAAVKWYENRLISQAKAAEIAGVSRAEFLNASPLILLANIDHLHLITSLAEVAVIPEAVAAEIRAGPVDDPARRWI